MNDPKALISVLAAPFRIVLLATFLLLAKMGWITWATPEAMHAQVNAIMDFLVVAVPAGYAVWAGFKAWRMQAAAALAKEPVEIIKAAAALPEVARIITTPAIADAIFDPTVTTR